ncbi:Protein takeout [Papilio xuthus]|uniref:Protein takeout n=1 Tax=Papilio xuthus TaxID=66420 RepID=A0A194PJG2_PAPXU|nr:Protein takeout [Papilio xuthus]
MADRCVKFLLVFCLTIICHNGEAAENEKPKLPDYLPSCKRSDPELDTCIKNSFNSLRPHLARGLTDLGVPPVEPLLIDRLVMENSAGPVRVTAAFSNITVIGPSNYTVTKIRSDLKKMRIDMGLALPRIEVSGHYEVSGQVLLFPVRSQGNFWAAFIDVAAIAKIYGKEIERDNEKYMSIERLLVDFKLKNSRFKVRDTVNHVDVAAITKIYGKEIERDNEKYMSIERLLVDFKLKNSRFKVRDTVNHGSVIGEAMNQFLNNNAPEIIEEMRPAASLAIAKHFQTFLNAAFNKIPINLWLQP